MPNINDLTYNGTNASSLGVYVTGSGTFNAPELDVTRYEVPGRNGDIILSNHRYKNIDVAYPAFIPNAFMAEVQSIRNWLRSSVGYARIEDTYDTTHYRMGIATELQEFSPVNQNRAANFQMVFNCKPQRFLKSGETEQTVVPMTETFTGNPASFESPSAVAMSSASASLSPHQDLNGYDKPWAGGSGKNKAKLSADNAGSNQRSTVAYTDTGATVTATNSYGRYGWLIPVTQGQTYTISYHAQPTADANYRLIFYGDQDGVWNGSSAGFIGSVSIPYDGSDVAFTFTATTSVLFFGVYVTASATSGSMEISNIQLELGSTATSFEPYSNICLIAGHDSATLYVSPTISQADATTYPVSFTSAGTVYGGTFDWVSGVLTVNWATIDLGTLSWSPTYNSGGVIVAFRTSQTPLGIKSVLMSEVSSAKCSIYKTVAYNDSVNGTISQDPMYLVVKDDRYTDATTFTNAMNGVQLVYELATPLTYNLTPQTVNTLAGQNYVWAEDMVTVQFAAGRFLLVNPTNYTAKPIFKVTNPNSDTLKVNGKTLTIGAYAGEMIIDCETENAYAGSSNLNSLVTGTFPTLKPGANTMSCTAATCKVIPRWWEL